MDKDPRGCAHMVAVLVVMHGLAAMNFADGGEVVQNAGHVHQQVTTLPDPTRCTKSVTDGNRFIQVLQTIVKHGDLTDVAFLAGALGTEFIVKSSRRSGAEPDDRTIRYRADSIFDIPMHIDLYVHQDHARSTRRLDVAFMRIESPAWPDPRSNFLAGCLRISNSEFSRSFGGGFLEAPLSDGMAAINARKELPSAETNGTTMSINYTYNKDDQWVTGVTIRQIS